jgi:cytochrome c553
MPTWIFAVLTFIAVISSAHAEDIAEKATLCASCHGENGVPVDPKIPVIWGQNAGYLYIELRDFKRGARTSEMMSPMAAGLSRDEMMALAEYFSKKPWPHLGQKPADAATAEHAQTVANSAQCSQCHLAGFLGASVVPRVSGQGFDYLLATLEAFRSGARANNAWMTDLMKAYSDDDMKALAAYLAGL